MLTLIRYRFCVASLYKLYSISRAEVFVTMLQDASLGFCQHMVARQSHVRTTVSCHV